MTAGKPSPSPPLSSSVLSPATRPLSCQTAHDRVDPPGDTHARPGDLCHTTSCAPSRGRACRFFLRNGGFRALPTYTQRSIWSLFSSRKDSSQATEPLLRHGPREQLHRVWRSNGPWEQLRRVLRSNGPREQLRRVSRSNGPREQLRRVSHSRPRARCSGIAQHFHQICFLEWGRRCTPLAPRLLPSQAVPRDDDMSLRDPDPMPGERQRLGSGGAWAFYTTWEGSGVRFSSGKVVWAPEVPPRRVGCRAGGPGPTLAAVSVAACLGQPVSYLGSGAVWPPPPSSPTWEALPGADGGFL
ncbi:uncharacterized protein LOC126932005 [Macaca thibetana thibetana]|uniref:uncharacterized protein LOC126932005 n=1 Tax=Macaca thibetana thibetana TaxID=257877 RepID=UPI0021BC4FCC|nr:uncharacterized protein LOC126932005 [Macaca thibetana thibetana]